MLNEHKPVFAAFLQKAWPFKFCASMHVDTLVGGIPSDPNVAEGWIRTKLGGTDDLVRQAVAETMVERSVTVEEATALVDSQRHLNGFKRTPEGELFIEGRQLKAAIKEAALVAAAAGKLPLARWGKTGKGLKSFIAEHVCVVEDRLVTGRFEPDGIEQRFVHTFRGSGIQYEEYLREVDLDFTILTDHEFTDEQWAMIWLTGWQQGIGATRSQGYGRYSITRWDRVK